MSIKLKCPTCRERLFADESDRGRSIKCPGCDARVPVPAGDGTAPAPAPTSAAALVKPIPTLPTLPVLKPLKPVEDDIVDAEVLSAPVLKPKSSASIPTVAPLPEPAAKKPKARTGFRLRGEEDDDRPRGRVDDEDEGADDREPAAKGSGLLIAILAVGVLLLGGIGFGVYYLTRDDTPAPIAAEDPDKGIVPGPNIKKNNDNNNPKPGGGVKRGNMPDGWDTVTTNEGFSFDAPKAGLSEGPFGAKGLTGKVWMSKELGGVGVAGAYLDRQPGAKLPPFLELTTEAFQLNGGKLEGRRRINDREVAEFQFNGGAVPSKVWLHVTTDRLFLFRFTGDVPPRSEAADKLEHFMANMKFTHPGGVDPVEPGPGPIEPGPGPGPGPRPRPDPAETPFEPVPTLAEDGFTVEMPGGSKVRGERHVANVDRKYHLGGKKFETKDGPVTFQLYYHDLPDEADYDADKCFKALMPHANQPAGGNEEKLDKHPATRWTIKNFFGGTSPALTVRVGFRVFSLMVTKEGIHNAIDPDLEARGKKFLDSLKVTFDPKKAAAAVAVDPKWVPMRGAIGFSALAPVGAVGEDYTAGFGFDKPQGKHFSSEDDTVKCHVYIVQMTPKHDPLKTVQDMVVGIHNADKVIDGPNKIVHGNAAGEEMIVEAFPFKNKVRVRTFVFGAVAVALKVEGKGNQPEREVILKARAFFANFQYGAGGGAVGPPPGPVQVGDGEFASAGKISPFWSAVLLPGKKELLTAGVRNPADPKPGGVLRRYSYPDFKLKATYLLPLPVSHAVAEETTGRLLCAVVSQWPGATLDPREGDSWYADLQLFDLNKITDGSVAEGEELKPVGNKISLGQPAVTGLAVDPTGRFGYAAATVTPPVVKGQPPRPPTGRLYKIDLTKGEVAGAPISHPEPLTGLRMHPFGKTLVTSELLVGDFRPGKQFNLLTVDAIGWKKSRLVPIAAPAKDLTFTGDGILALATVDGKNKVFGYRDGDPETMDVTPKDIPLDGFAFLRATADGRRVVASAGKKQNGLLLMGLKGEGDKAKFETVTSGANVANVPTGGQFLLTPDSKFAVFNSGAVVDLTKTVAAPKE